MFGLQDVLEQSGFAGTKESAEKSDGQEVLPSIRILNLFPGSPIARGMVAIILITTQNNTYSWLRNVTYYSIIQKENVV